MRPSENQLYLVHYRTDDLSNVVVSKKSIYATSPEHAKEIIEERIPDVIVMSVWERVWSRGDETE